jgi:hypothetical protein
VRLTMNRYDVPLKVRRDEIEAARDEALAQLQSANITAETKSQDPYVRRARPTFLYVIIAAMAYSLIVAPVINACLHKGLVPMQIPDSPTDSCIQWRSDVCCGALPESKMEIPAKSERSPSWQHRGR